MLLQKLPIGVACSRHTLGHLQLDDFILPHACGTLFSRLALGGKMWQRIARV